MMYDKIIITIIVIVNLSCFVCSQGISSDTITTITKEFDSTDPFNEIKKIYEISDSSLDEGYSALLNEKDAFRINIKEKNYYIIVWNITSDEVRVIFPEERQLIFGMDDVILVDINQDGKLDVQLEIKSIEDSENVSNRKVTLYVKKIVEKDFIPSGDYFELFDVTVELIEKELYTSRDLSAFIVFENFGEGPSEIEIVYSIINETGEEVYRGVDSKVVQTEDSVVKNFDFLELPLGKYTLRADIFYGQNQTGEAQENFEIVEASFINMMGNPLLFVLVVVGLLVVTMYMRKIYRKKNSV